MIFQGDLSRYHPADALMFLSQLSLNGVLSVAHEDRMLALSFKEGHLLDAQSAKSDEKILRILRFRKWIDGPREARIRQIRSETGLPVRQIVSELDLFPLADIRSVLEIGIAEVLLDLFLLPGGTFHFTDTPVDPDPAGTRMDTGAAAITVLSQADEFRNFEKAVINLDRTIQWRRSAVAPQSFSNEEKIVLHMASQPVRLRHLIAQVPLGSHVAMSTVEKLLTHKHLELSPLPPNDSAPAGARDTALDPLFAAYKQALKMLMTAGDVLKKMEAVIAFCKNYYDLILILTVRDHHIIHAKVIRIEKDRKIHQQSLKGDIGALDQCPMLNAVRRSGIGFFGRVFPSAVLDKILAVPSAGECALLPILHTPQVSMIFYAFSQTHYAGLSPHHYLELLSWLIAPGAEAATGAPPDRPQNAVPAHGTQATARVESNEGLSRKENMVRLVEKIDDLPPFPMLVSKALEMLSNPELAIDAVEKIIAQDQALVAKMIRVGNSALYGGFQKVGTLRQALTRLGAKTTKSLILAASTRSYFLKDRGGMHNWGQILWQHSVEVGLASRRIALTCGQVDPEQAFIAGVMHDVGKLVLLKIDSEKYKEIQRRKVVDRLTDLAAETEVLALNHIEVGRLLMGKWHMPETVRTCIQYHHAPDSAAEHATLVASVAFGNYLSHTMGSHLQPDHLEDPARTHPFSEMLGISEQAHHNLVEAIRADFQNTELMM